MYVLIRPEITKVIESDLDTPPVRNRSYWYLLGSVVCLWAWVELVRL